MKDCIIIGSGPAGISSALTLKANGKDFLLFGKKELSQKVVKAEKIRNYPGLSNITGKEFQKAFIRHLTDMQIAITEEKVLNVYPLKDKFGVATAQGNYYESRSLILACGVENIKTIDGEQEFLGRGVSYCATCDGFLYKDKKIAVLCTSKELEEEVLHLAHFAQEVYLIAMYKNVSLQQENIKLMPKMPKRIIGDKRVTALEFEDKKLEVDGFFALRESVSPALLMEGITMQNGHVVVNREMQTNIPGCYAVGDCVGKPYQYAKAVGEGNVAAHSVTRFLNKNG